MQENSDEQKKKMTMMEFGALTPDLSLFAILIPFIQIAYYVLIVYLIVTAIKFMKNKNKQDAMLVQRLEKVEKQLAEMNHHLNERSE